MKWPIAVFAAFALGCLLGCSSSGVAEEEDSRNVAETKLVEFDDTTVPAVKRDREVEWTAYLIKQLVDGIGGFYEIPLLLEIARHEESVLFDAVQEFKSARPAKQSNDAFVDWYDVRDNMQLITNVKLALPHDKSPERNSRMWPLDIDDGTIVLIGGWGGMRFGIWSDPFDTRQYVRDDSNGELVAYESSNYLVTKTEFGVRNLQEFQGQFLSDEKRDEFWRIFIEGEPSDG